jgi:transketolase
VTITGTAPVYVGPSYSKIDTYIETDEDVELAQAKLQEVSSQIQDSLNRFNDSNVEYQAILQKDIQDAQLNDSNEARKLQKYSSEVQTYGSEVNARVQEWVNEEWTQKFQKYQQDYSSRLQEYNTNLQNALNKFNKENTLYQNELQEKIQESNNQQTKDSAEYSANIQKYSNEMQGYSAEVNKSVQDFNTKLQKHSTDYQWLQSQYAQLKSDYNSGLQLLLGRPLAAGEQQGR